MNRRRRIVETCDDLESIARDLRIIADTLVRLAELGERTEARVIHLLTLPGKLVHR